MSRILYKIFYEFMKKNFYRQFLLYQGPEHASGWRNNFMPAQAETKENRALTI